jgi:hypothetical protein
MWEPRFLTNQMVLHGLLQGIAVFFLSFISIRLLQVHKVLILHAFCTIAVGLHTSENHIRDFVKGRTQDVDNLGYMWFVSIWRWYENPEGCVTRVKHTNQDCLQEQVNSKLGRDYPIKSIRYFYHKKGRNVLKHCVLEIKGYVERRGSV